MDINWDQSGQMLIDSQNSISENKSIAQIDIYDTWQESNSAGANTLPFNNEPISTIASNDDSNVRLAKMLASQAKLKFIDLRDEDAMSQHLTINERKQLLQQNLVTAASNGDSDRINKLFITAKEYLNINARDEDGNVPLIYASCFGYFNAVCALVENGAKVEESDSASWTSLMWAINNRQQDVVKYLLDHGASLDSKTISGRSAFDFIAPNSDMSDFLQRNGYSMTKDFYEAGQDKFEEEMAEAEMHQRMLMESAINLEIDLGNLINDEPEDSDQEFAWDRCLHDQMFVFQQDELDKILDVVIRMTPTRSKAQKPIPANLLFLAARYAHYYASQELLEILLSKTFGRINAIVDKHKSDMTLLAFWISNSTLLLHYLRKDTGLVHATAKYQLALEEVIHEIFILIIRDAESRMDKHLEKGMLEYESIPGFESVTFQNQWKIFRSKPKLLDSEKGFRPPPAAQSPRNISSLLSSTLFVLELYDIHSVIVVQVINQLLYWLGAEIFNRILDNSAYLSRTKAMQIRMNVLTLEDWARANVRQPSHFENGSTFSTGETAIDATRRHLEPVLQLLQWLQALSSIGDDFEALICTLQQLPRLKPSQLIRAAKDYRVEVGEKPLTKASFTYLEALKEEISERDRKEPLVVDMPTSDTADNSETPFLDPTAVLSFRLPTTTDMLVSFGAGFGGQDKERERKYVPSVPHEFLARLDFRQNKISLYKGNWWDIDDT